MSNDTPALPGNDLDGDQNAMFDELARRAGAALRRPAPADGVRAIVTRRRRQQALKATVVGGVGVVALIGALVVSQRGEPDRLPPVDTVTATVPTTVSTPTTTGSVPVDSVSATIPSQSSAMPSLWVNLEPGATAPLPRAPIPAHYGSALVWTGTELIVWGGLVDDGPCCSVSQDGAAFDPAAGTWRQIAPPPNQVKPGVVLWTGTEMLVWSDGTPDTVSAAYDPALDTWRMIADPPAAALTSVAFWIGDAAVVLLGDPGVGLSGFAYSPAADEWRRLAEGPWDSYMVWTGSTILTVTDPSSDAGGRLAGYDPATDTWRVLEKLGGGGEPVVIPGRGGAPATVAFLPGETGAPVQVLDDRGNTIGEWAGRPAELPAICETNPERAACLSGNTSLAVSVGGEVLLWGPENGWAFEPETQTWRSFPLDGRQPGWDGTEVVAAGDLLFAWGADRDGLLYRASTSG